MSIITPDTIVQGRAYIIWVKDMKGYSDPDNMYGVAFKGNSRFGHQDFSTVCKTRNDKTFYSKMIKDGEDNPTWQDCLDALKMEKAPIGNPQMFTDRAYTFAELATIAYDGKYFKDEEGLQHLAQKTAPPKSAVKKSEIKKPESKEEVEILDEDMENMKERAVLAESRAAALLHDREVLEKKVEELRVKLESSLEHQRNFMISADKATVTMESMNDDTATKVIKKIDPKLHLLPSIDSNLGSLLAKMTEIGSAVANLPQLVREQAVAATADKFAQLELKLEGADARADSNSESLSEGLMTIENTLASFGMTEEEESIDIPACMRSLVEKRKGGSSFPGQGPRSCTFIDNKEIATFVCMCGCGREMKVDHQVPTAGFHGQERYDGQVGTQQQLYSAQRPLLTQTSAGNPAQLTNTSVTLQGAVRPDTASYSTSAGPATSSSWSTPAPSASYLAPVNAPGYQPITPTTSSSGSGFDPPTLTRKQKRAARLMEYKEMLAAKKLKYNDDTAQSGSWQAYGGIARETQASYGAAQGQVGQGSVARQGGRVTQAYTASYGEGSQVQVGRGGGAARQEGRDTQAYTANYGVPSQVQAGRVGGDWQTNQSRSFLPNWGPGLLQQPTTVWNQSAFMKPN